MSNDAIHVHRYGNPDAPPLVLVHGLTDDGTNWPDAVFRWAFHWDIHAMDQRGHGSSPRFTPDDVSSSHRLWVEDLRSLLAGLPQPPVVVGHSLGGLVALRVAVESPDLVRALVLEDPARPGPGDGPDPRFAADQQRFVSAFPKNTAAEIDRMRQETPWSDAEIRAWAESKAKVDHLMLERGLFLGDSSWEPLFGAVAVPTLLVLPGDGGMGPDTGQFHNPLVERVLVQGAGHCIRRDRPEEFYAAVEPFLASHRVTVSPA